MVEKRKRHLQLFMVLIGILIAIITFCSIKQKESKAYKYVEDLSMSDNYLDLEAAQKTLKSLPKNEYTDFLIEYIALRKDYLKIKNPDSNVKILLRLFW